MLMEENSTIAMNSTNTAEYWRVGFTITKDIITYLYEYLVEVGIPKSTEELTRLVMQRQIQAEFEAQERAQREKGTVYRPKNHYAVGDLLSFSEMAGLSGVVVGFRAGENPEYGDFRVIQVKMDGAGEVREFAAEFQQPHLLSNEVPKISADDLFRRHGAVVARQVRLALEANPEFVSFGEDWFLKDLLPEVHIGHMNIAEAMIDIAEQPLSPVDLLRDVELPEGVAEPARVFALNLALSADKRFVKAGNDGRVQWSLAARTVELTV